MINSRADGCTTMPEVRAVIDEIDVILVNLLALRAGYIDRAAAIKTTVGWPARIDSRVEEVAMNTRRNAEAVGLDPDFTEHLWRQIIDWSIAREDRLLAEGGQKE